MTGVKHQKEQVVKIINTKNIPFENSIVFKSRLDGTTKQWYENGKFSRPSNTMPNASEKRSEEKSDDE